MWHQPKDSIAYCIIRIKPEAESTMAEGFLARVDSDGFAIVARTPNKLHTNSASFDESGTYWASKDTAIWKLEASHELKGGHSMSDDLPEIVEVGEGSVAHGIDCVVWRDHLVSISKGEVLVTDIADPDLKSWVAKPNPSPALPGYFGSAYLYSGSMYFSANDGSGVYRIEIDLAQGSFIGTRIGASFNNRNNDGLNCIFTQSPDEVAAEVKDAGVRPSTLRVWVLVFASFGLVLIPHAPA
mmetsp:Transcript_78483/g.227824  ORF Transcript_78483/g.227824 Transcript_78483/m.227824 type:complete len:241 (-) Transcript_78483:47-769(-)